MEKKKNFTNVYYIAQVSPIYKICGFTFNSDKAKAMSNQVKKITGHSGRIIKFTRQELIDLEYSSTLI